MARLKIVEVKLQDIQKRNLSFVIPNCEIKVLSNLRRGHRNFIAVKNGVVVADVWRFSLRNNGTSISYPDTIMLGIDCELGVAYAFNMYVAPWYGGGWLYRLINSCSYVYKMMGAKRYMDAIGMKTFLLNRCSECLYSGVS